MTNSVSTTHVGSLPRNAELTELLFAAEREEPVDQDQFDHVVAAAVDEVVRRQVEVGITIVSDGEMSKISYATYIKDRISGFAGDSPRRAPADLEAFPTFLERQSKGGGTPSYRRPRCIGVVEPVTLEPLEKDIHHFAASRSRHGEPAGFMNAASPGVIALFQPNDFYPDDDSYLEALAEAMRPEYEAIVSAGLVLQLDSPDLGLGRHMMFKDRSDDDYLKAIGRHVEVLNHALRNVPADRCRMHVCWGNYEGPHHCDVEMAVILPTLLSAKPAGLLFETANPRHQHDWEAFEASLARLPPDKILIPGVIDTTTNFVEHPRVVAERVERFTRMVGPDRVVASTDCGFSTFAGFGAVDPNIVWAKLTSLVEGSGIAAERMTRWV